MASADMDVDMDIDLGPIDIPENALEPTSEYSNGPLASGDLIINDLSIPSDHQPSSAISGNETIATGTATPHKVHIRGVDDMTTADIIAYSTELFSTNTPVRIEWIDDTSANIVYETPAVGMLALAELSQQPGASGPSVADIPTLQLRSAKPSPIHTSVTNLQIRGAVSTDQKQARAHESSRFYLLHPEHDPREQRRREKKGGNQENGNYRRRRYGDDEHRRRRRRDEADGFDASMYDDDNDQDQDMDEGQASSSRRGSFASSSEDRSQRRRRDRRRRSYSRGRSASPGRNGDSGSGQNGRRRGTRRRTPPPGYSADDPYPVPAANSGKELFPVKAGREDAPGGAGDAGGRAGAADLFSDRLVKASSSLLSSSSSLDPPPSKPSNNKKELFPSKTSTSVYNYRNGGSSNHRRSSHDDTNIIIHRRTDAFDAGAAERPEMEDAPPADLFAGRLSRPSQLLGGSGGLGDRVTLPGTSTNSSAAHSVNGRGSNTVDQGLFIRGGASNAAVPELSIRGAAKLRELFPEKIGADASSDPSNGGGNNAGKELFAARVSGLGEGAGSGGGGRGGRRGGGGVGGRRDRDRAEDLFS